MPAARSPRALVPVLIFIGTVVAVISGNGLKTLQEHPDKPWPEMVACDVETMGAMLADFRQAATALH